MDNKGYPKVLDIFEKIWQEEVATKGIDATQGKLKEWVYDWFLTAWKLRTESISQGLEGDCLNDFENELFTIFSLLLQVAGDENETMTLHDFVKEFSEQIKSEAIKQFISDNAISCNVFLYDGGRLLDYTQEQQDNALDKIGAEVGDKVKIIIIKD